jgi:hypothetical protein
MPPCFTFIVLGLFDFSLLRTHFCLFTDVQRRIPRCVTREVWKLWPKARTEIETATLLSAPLSRRAERGFKSLLFVERLAKTTQD